MGGWALPGGGTSGWEGGEPWGGGGGEGAPFELWVEQHLWGGEALFGGGGLVRTLVAPP